MSGNPKLNEVAEKTMRKYGVGSCGPRGFYGTIGIDYYSVISNTSAWFLIYTLIQTDTHIFVERRISQFVGTDDAVLYSSSFCTISSVIPTFSKRGDIIICDRGVIHALQTGLVLSR